MPKKPTTSNKQSPASTDTVTESSTTAPNVESDSQVASAKNRKLTSDSSKKSTKPKAKRASAASSEANSTNNEVSKESVSKKTAKKPGSLNKEKSTPSRKKTSKQAALPLAPETTSNFEAVDSTSHRPSYSATLNITDEVIRYRAYLLSEQRHKTGHAGSPEQDWEAAKQQLLQEALAQRTP